ncbi:MAG: hypothetical protein IJL80_10110 [Treponema sp.]|nr:hypothetical protein [Treponema sp.]
MGNAVFQISNKIFKSFNNSLYISIGQERYDIDICIALLLAGLLTCILFFFYAENCLELKDSLDEFNSTLSEQKKDKKQDRSKVIEESYSLNNRIQGLYHKSIFFGIVGGIIFVISIFVMLATQITVKDKVFLYRNTKAVVTPYIEKDELDFIDSKFHQIQSKEDFDEIFTEINKLLMKENRFLVFKKNNKVEVK